jgi:hypothetical protein
MNWDSVIGFVISIDWRSLLFVWMLAYFAIALWRLDQDKKNPFKLYQMISDQFGRADKYAVIYVLMGIVSVWAVWYEAGNGRLTEWLLTVVLGAFVAGAVAKTITAAAERVKTKDVADSTTTIVTQQSEQTTKETK